MRPSAIISRSESLKILEHDLRKLALEKHAAKLSGAAKEERAQIMVRIEEDIQKELRLRAKKMGPDSLLH